MPYPSSQNTIETFGMPYRGSTPLEESGGGSRFNRYQGVTAEKPEHPAVGAIITAKPVLIFE